MYVLDIRTEWVNFLISFSWIHIEQEEAVEVMLYHWMTLSCLSIIRKQRHAYSKVEHNAWFEILESYTSCLKSVVNWDYIRPKSLKLGLFQYKRYSSTQFVLKSPCLYVWRTGILTKVTVILFILDAYSWLVLLS